MTKKHSAAVDSEPREVELPTVRTVMNTALTIHGLLAIIYGTAALAHPSFLEPLHAKPSPAHEHWFHLHGIAMLAVGLVALYSSAFITDRVHTYWIGATMWLWTGATSYFTYYDHINKGPSTQALVIVLAILMGIYAIAFLIVSILPGAPVTSHLGSHSAHHERKALHEAKHSHRE